VDDKSDLLETVEQVEELPAAKQDTESLTNTMGTGRCWPQHCTFSNTALEPMDTEEGQINS
jgi:hypothetical protein